MLIYVGGRPRINVYEQMGLSNDHNLRSLLSPGHTINPNLRHDIPYAVDNGKFAVWSNGGKWDEAKFLELLAPVKALTANKPDWIVVPDKVASKDETLRLWYEWEPRLRGLGVPLAIAVQDGMIPNDVPASADVIFVGGSLEWKLRTASIWAREFPRVHVARVNYWYRLVMCYIWHVESVDGTGWFRGGSDSRQAKDLRLFLLWQRGLIPIERPEAILFLSPKARDKLLGATIDNKKWHWSSEPLFSAIK